jgi:uncharacterized protein
VVVDTNVPIAGISGFREQYAPGRNASADILHQWAEKSDFAWIVTEEILDEYKEVLRRLRVRPNLIGRVVNLIREHADETRTRSSVEISPDPEDDPFCRCAEEGKADFIVTLNAKDFPQERLHAKVTSPVDFLMRDSMRRNPGKSGSR